MVCHVQITTTFVRNNKVCFNHNQAKAVIVQTQGLEQLPLLGAINSGEVSFRAVCKLNQIFSVKFSVNSRKMSLHVELTQVNDAISKLKNLVQLLNESPNCEQCVKTLETLRSVDLDQLIQKFAASLRWCTKTTGSSLDIPLAQVHHILTTLTSLASLDN